MTMTNELAAGFADKVVSAQATFRAVMEAMARPGTVQQLDAKLRHAPLPLMPAAAAIALTLFDHDTPIWLDAPLKATPAVTSWLRFHTAAPLTDATADAAFALVSSVDQMPVLDQFALGSNDYPDRSTTLVLQLSSLEVGDAFELQGPGINGRASLHAPLPAELIAQRASLQPLFPRGLDLILVASDALVAIPRTTQIMPKGAA